ncbi:MAG: hypothetical protein ACK5TU_06655, partial [Cyclobacteriaceae bacterium]
MKQLFHRRVTSWSANIRYTTARGINVRHAILCGDPWRLASFVKTKSILNLVIDFGNTLIKTACFEQE